MEQKEKEKEFKQIKKLNVALFNALFDADNEQKKIEKIKEAVENGADINCKLDGQTPLHVAVEYEEAAVVKMLVLLGANVKIKDDEGFTPMDCAEKRGNLDIIGSFPSDAIPRNTLSLKKKNSIASERKVRIRKFANTHGDQSRKPTTAKFKPLEKGYYISRILKHHNTLKKEVLEILSNDILARNEEQFIQLCRENPDDNVHLLTKTKKGHLVWHKTRGCIDLIAQHVDVEKATVYSAKLMDKLLNMADCQRIMLIVDQPGMGKSIILTYIAHMIKRRSPLHWVSRIDLNDFCNEFGVYKESESDEDYICRKLFKLNSQLEVYLFKKCLRQNMAVLMLDGFDEISPLYKKAVIKFLLYLKNTQIRQLWITSRPHLETELVTVLEQLPLHLKSFSKSDQIRFLIKFWNLITLKNTNSDIKRLRDCAHILVDKLMISLSDEDREFTGIPLLTRMLAEAYGNQIRIVEVNSLEYFCLPDILDLSRLFKEFFIRKFDIHNQKSKSIGEERFDINAVNPLKVHQYLAIELLFPKNHSFILGAKTAELSMTSLSVEALTRYGIVYRDGKILRFTHRAFAEFLAAVYFTDKLRKSKQCKEINNFFFQDMLVKREYRVIRRFIEGLLNTAPISDEAFQEYGELLVTLWTQQGNKQIVKTGVILLPLIEANSNILNFLLKCLKSKNMNTVKEILTINLSNNKNCWQIAASHRFYNTLSVVLEWNKENNLSVKHMLLEKVQDGNTVFHLAVIENNIKVVRLLCNWAKKEGINFPDLLKLKNNNEISIWHLIANVKHFEIFQIFRTFINDEDIDKKLFSNEIQICKNTIWHEVVKCGNGEILSTFFQWYLKTKKGIQSLLFDSGVYGQNVWHEAMKNSNLECLNFLYSIVLKYQVPMEKIFFATDNNGNNVFHISARYNQAEAFRCMWKLIPNKELKTLIFTRTNFKRESLWNVTQYRKSNVVFRVIWECAVEINADISTVLFVPDSLGNDVWSAMFKCGDSGMINTVLAYASDKKIGIHRFLNVKYRNGCNLLHIVSSEENVGVLETLQNCFATANIDTKQIMLKRNSDGATPLHIAATKGKDTLFKSLLDWIQSAHCDTREFLSRVDCDDNTVWHSAAKGGQESLLDELFTTFRRLGHKQFIEISLSKVNKDGNTPWLCAAAEGHVKAMALLIKKGNIALRKLLEQRNSRNQHAWHLCALHAHDSALCVLLPWCFKAKLDFWRMVNSKDSDGNTLFHLATKGKCAQAMVLILETITKLSKSLDDVFRDWNRFGDTVFLCATKQIKMMSLLWPWLKRTQLDLSDVLLAKNDLGFTAWHMAASRDDSIVLLDFLWKCADEVRVPHEVILLDIDNAYKYTLLHLCASSVRNIWSLKSVWRRAEATQVVAACLSIKDTYGRTIMHTIARNGFSDALDLISKDVTIRDLKSKDDSGGTVLHAACESYSSHSIQAIHKMALVKMDARLASEFLVARDSKGNTALDLAIRSDKSWHIKPIMLWAVEVGCDLRSLLASKNSAGDSVWFVGVRECSSQSLRELRKWVPNTTNLNMGTVLGLTDAKGQSLLEAVTKQEDDVLISLVGGWEYDRRFAPRRRKRGRGKRKQSSK